MFCAYEECQEVGVLPPPCGCNLHACKHLRTLVCEEHYLQLDKDSVELPLEQRPDYVNSKLKKRPTNPERSNG